MGQNQIPTYDGLMNPLLQALRDLGGSLLQPENPMNKVFRRLALVAFLAFASTYADAAEKLTITVNKQTISAYRTADLESAKKEARASHKPIAWIASSPKLLDGQGAISQKNSRGATLHALFALRDRAVLVFMDAFEENHKVLQLVDDALHTPDPHYTPPTVVFLDPEAKQVLAKVIYEPDFEKRAKALAKALEEIKGKT
jgi:hypothetical protein